MRAEAARPAEEDAGERACDPVGRLRGVAWEALAGLAGDAEEALRAVLAAAPAERVLDALLRKRRALRNEQRAALAEAVFGVALWRRRLARALGHARWEAVPARELLCALVHTLGGVAEARARELCGVAAEAPLRWAADDATWTMAERWSLPDWLAAEIADAAGAEAEDLARSLCSPGPIFLRANLLHATPPELAESLSRDGIATRPGRFAPHALRVETARPNLLGSRAHRAGLFEAQDEGSQLLGALVGAQPGETVFDACAGAGGKALLLAAEMDDRGRLIAADVDGERLSRLRARAARAGASCIETCAAGAVPDLRFDRALVDAPCSELGALRRGPDARWRLRPGDFSALPALQLEILSGAARRLRASGRLVYATCTFRRAENEEVAEAFEAAHPSFERVPPGEGALDPSFVSGGFFRSFPHRHGCDGFFAAVWRRGPDSAEERTR